MGSVSQGLALIIFFPALAQLILTGVAHVRVINLWTCDRLAVCDESPCSMQSLLEANLSCCHARSRSLRERSAHGLLGRSLRIHTSLLLLPPLVLSKSQGLPFVGEPAKAQCKEHGYREERKVGAI